MEDLIYTLLGLAVIVLPIYFIVKAVKKKKNKQDKKTVNFKQEKPIKEKKVKTVKMFPRHIEGIDLLKEEEKCTLIINNETFKVEAQSGSFNIPLERITNVGFLTKDEMVLQNKSVFKRAFAGSIVGLGALGALSGIGQKVKKQTNYFVVVSYKSKENEEIKLLVFGLDKYDSISSHFVAQLTKRITVEKLDIEL